MPSPLSQDLDFLTPPWTNRRGRSGLPLSLACLALACISANASAQEASATVQASAQSNGAAQSTATTEPASATDPAKEEKSEFNGGLYFDAFGSVLFSPTGSTHEWSEGCPSIDAINWSPGCTTRAPIGMLIGGRLGFRFGVLGIEAFGVGSADWSRAEFDAEIPGVPALATDMQVGRIGGGPGGGLRLMTKPGAIRLTAGAGAGLMLRHVYTNYSSLDGASTFYHAPFVMGDVSVMIGPFNLGVVALLEFVDHVDINTNLAEQVGAPAAIDSALSPIRVYQGNQFFIGPMLGLHFGN